MTSLIENIGIKFLKSRPLMWPTKLFVIIFLVKISIGWYSFPRLQPRKIKRHIADVYCCCCYDVLTFGIKNCCTARNDVYCWGKLISSPHSTECSPNHETTLLLNNNIIAGQLNCTNVLSLLPVRSWADHFANQERLRNDCLLSMENETP